MDPQEIGRQSRQFLEYYERLEGPDELPLPLAFDAWATGKDLSPEDKQAIGRRLDQLNGVSFDIEITGETAEMVRRLMRKLDLPVLGVIGHALQRLEWKVDRESEGLQVVAIPRDRTDEVEEEGYAE